MIVAHVFLAPYTLPVPFWLYLYGCAAALVLSFALLAYLASSGPAHDHRKRYELLGRPLSRAIWRWMVTVLRAAHTGRVIKGLAVANIVASPPGIDAAQTAISRWFAT